MRSFITIYSLLIKKLYDETFVFKLKSVLLYINSKDNGNIRTFTHVNENSPRVNMMALGIHIYVKNNQYTLPSEINKLSMTFMIISYLI